MEGISITLVGIAVEGFCISNIIAILTEHLRERFGVKRILVLDYDVHFGNGTSNIFYSDPSTLFISLHQDPRTIFSARAKGAS